MAGAKCSNYDSETAAVKLRRHLDVTIFWFMLRLWAIHWLLNSPIECQFTVVFREELSLTGWWWLETSPPMDSHPCWNNQSTRMLTLWQRLELTSHNQSQHKTTTKIAMTPWWRTAYKSTKSKYAQSNQGTPYHVTQPDKISCCDQF